VKATSYVPNILSSYGFYGSISPIAPKYAEKAMAYYNGSLYTYVAAYTTSSAFKTAMSGVYLNYELSSTEYYLLDDEWQADSAWSYNVNDWGTEEVVNSSIGVSTPIEGTIKYYNPLR